MKNRADAVFVGADSVPFFKQGDLTVPAGTNITDFNAINIVSGTTLTSTRLKDLIEGANFGTITTARDLTTSPLPATMTGIGDDTIPNLYNLIINQVAKIPIAVIGEDFFGGTQSDITFYWDWIITTDVNADISLGVEIMMTGIQDHSPTPKGDLYYALTVKPQFTLTISQNDGTAVIVRTQLVDADKTNVQLMGPRPITANESCNIYTCGFKGTASVDPIEVPLEVDAHFTGGHIGDIAVAESYDSQWQPSDEFSKAIWQIMYDISSQYDVRKGMRYLLSNYGFTTASERNKNEKRHLSR
jgi:hypothetical protein